ncbi:hypothetical protein AB0P15_28355 [Streptomyces sp. NPDC087917]|uniref:hypothetical protein n=1 Tax=Streptomyces sp. NPDC087917 TaxID=3155060 RepID=UPI00342CF84E
MTRGPSGRTRDRDHPGPVDAAGAVPRSPPPPPADQRAAERLALLNAAAAGIGSSLDMVRDAERPAGTLVPAFADLAAVDLPEPVLLGEEPGGLVVTGAPVQRAVVRAVAAREPLRSGSRYTAAGKTIRTEQPLDGAVEVPRPPAGRRWVRAGAVTGGGHSTGRGYSRRKVASASADVVATGSTYSRKSRCRRKRPGAPYDS